MLERIMQSTCEIALNVEQYPRTSIVITVQEMQNRGNVLLFRLFLFSYGPPFYNNNKMCLSYCPLA